MSPESVREALARADTALGAARTLLGAGYTEDSISRSYYAVVNAATAALMSRGVRVRSHRALNSLFGLHLVKEGPVEREFAAILVGLQQDRDTSDYDFSASFERDEAVDRLRQAERFVGRIKLLLAGEGRPPQSEQEAGGSGPPD